MFVQIRIDFCSQKFSVLILVAICALLLSGCHLLMLSDNFLTIVFMYTILVAKVFSDLIVTSIAELVDG